MLPSYVSISFICKLFFFSLPELFISFYADEKEAEERSLYRVHVITGDVIGAGTDADVFITFIGTDAESGKSDVPYLNFPLLILFKSF